MDKFLQKSTSLYPCTSSCTDRQHSKYGGHRQAPAEDGGFKAMTSTFLPNYELPHCKPGQV